MMLMWCIVHYCTVCYSVTVCALYCEIMLFDISSGLDSIVKMCFNDSLQLFVIITIQCMKNMLKYSSEYNTLYVCVCSHHHSNNLQYSTVQYTMQ